MIGSRHRINDDWRLLTLKLVDSTDPGTGNALLKLEDLRVVRSDDQDIAESNKGFDAVSIDPGRARSQYFRDEVTDCIGLLRRGALISPVLDRKVSKTRTFQSAAGFDFLMLQTRTEISGGRRRKVPN